MKFKLKRQLLRSVVLLGLLASLSGCASTLEKAVESGDLDAVQQAIDRGGRVNGHLFSATKFPMDIAMLNNDLEMIQLLHKNGATIDWADLGKAAQAGAKNTYEYVLTNGSSLTACPNDLDYPGFWQNALPGTFNQMPALGSAIARKDLESVAQLIELGSPLETRCEVALGGDYNFSAIILASHVGDAPIVDYLIGQGALPNRLTVGGFTPLAIASYRGHYEAARVLLAKGAFHTYTAEAKQPIEYAIDTGHEDLANLLAYAGAVRPRRKEPIVDTEVVVSALWEGVKFAAQMYVIYLGARYSGYDSSYGSTDNSTDVVKSISNALSDSKKEPRRRDEKAGCWADANCGPMEICVKKPLIANGICVNDGGQTRSRADYNTTKSGSVKSGSDTDPKDCPLGTHWDQIYQDCIN